MAKIVATSCHLCSWTRTGQTAVELLDARAQHVKEAHPEAIEAGDPFATRAWEARATHNLADWASNRDLRSK